MPELDLPACPICLAENSLSLKTVERAGERITWYTCRECTSDLLSIGHGRWVYKKIGGGGKSDLLHRPLTGTQLRQLLATPVAAPQAAPRTLLAALWRIKELSPLVVGSAIAVGICLAGTLLLMIMPGIGLGPAPPAAGAPTEVALLPSATATSTPTPVPAPTATRIPPPRPTPTPCPAGSPIVIGHWQIQVRQILVAQSISSAYGDGIEKAAGRFVLLFMTVTNQGRLPDTFVAFATLEIQDAEGRRYPAHSVATHYAQSTHRTSLAVDVAPRTGAYIVVVYDISPRSEFYALVPGALAGQHSASVLLDIP
ncbi:MAG: hypothetical protein JXA93_08625 [Anaerolineae bacterium]|nr:hypothetical protein [Anaerolineae bacterium]